MNVGGGDTERETGPEGCSILSGEAEKTGPVEALHGDAGHVGDDEVELDERDRVGGIEQRAGRPAGKGQPVSQFSSTGFGREPAQVGSIPAGQAAFGKPAGQ